MTNETKAWRDAYDGLDYVMEQFPYVGGGYRLPRTIMTGVTVRTGKGQVSVDRRETIMEYYKASLYEDCRINAYPDFDALKQEHHLPQDYKPKPDHIFIDLDRETFQTDEELERALEETESNIAKYFSQLHPGRSVIWSGNGYHVHVHLQLEAAFEEMPDFAGFDNQSNKFLRWAERKLSNGKSDPRHKPSLNSCLFRVPGTVNSKAKTAGRDPLVKIIKPWYAIDAFSRTRPTQQFLNEFHAYLVQEVIDDKIEKLERRNRLSTGLFKNMNSTPWIDTLLQIGIEDNRKDIIFWVLAPYLITVKGLDYDKAYDTIEEWLEKCDDIRRLEPGWTSFRYRIRYCLDTAENQERKPIKFETFKSTYPDIYKKLNLTELR